MSEVTEYIRLYGIDSTDEYPLTVTERDGNNIEIRDSYISTTGEINEQNILIEFLDKTNNKTKNDSEVEILNLLAFAERYDFGIDCPNCGHLYYHPKKL